MQIISKRKLMQGGAALAVAAAVPVGRPKPSLMTSCSI
jgi:hypothetical protein